METSILKKNSEAEEWVHSQLEAFAVKISGDVSAIHRLQHE
jgi:hypothetical protein